MISQRQTEALLTECEKSIGSPLKGLRQRLARQDKIYSNLWELITLYCTLPLGSIIHEPEQNCPDICIKHGAESHLWIESTYIYSKSKQGTDNAKDFISWILNHLKRMDITFATGVHVDLAAHNNSKAFAIPNQNRWGELIRDPSWYYFVNILKNTNHAEVEWICPMGNATIKLRRTSHSGTVSIGLPPIKEPASPKQHPVYKEIKKKAEQAQKWNSSGKSYHPLVLCIGASENPWEINSRPSSGVSLRQAVYSSLLDVRNMNLSVQANITKRIDGKSFNVPGAKYISAVMVVTLETKTSIIQPNFYRIPQKTIFLNGQALRPLSSQEIQLLEQISFDRIEWGPGWEAWEKPRGSKRSENTPANRIKRQWGEASMRYISNGAFEIELSANVIAQLLSGDITHEDLRQQYSDDLANTLKNTIKQGQSIIGCEFIAANPISRKHDCIRLKYSFPKPQIISDPQKGKGSPKLD
jgi:hypothetical protein